jgi:hypothetical protein
VVTQCDNGGTSFLSSESFQPAADALFQRASDNGVTVNPLNSGLTTESVQLGHTANSSTVSTTLTVQAFPCSQSQNLNMARETTGDDVLIHLYCIVSWMQRFV